MKTSSRQLMLGFFLTLALFFAMKVVFKFPFGADDYWYNLHTQNQQFHLDLFGSYLARVPFWCLTIWAIFTSGLAQHDTLIYTLGFAVNAGSLMILASMLRTRLRGQGVVRPVFVILCGLFAFFPNDHEILYWLTCWPYIGGLPLLVLGWSTRQPLLKMLAYVLSFCFGEMFILPALALELVPWLFPKAGEPDVWNLLGRGYKPARRQLLLHMGYWLGSVSAFLLLRKVLSLVFGDYAHTLAHDPWLLPVQLRNLFEHFFVLSFYKTFWSPTLLYWLALGWVLVRGVRRGILTKGYLLNGICFILLAGSLVFVMGYFAPRALYGASVLVNAWMIVTLEPVLARESRGFKSAMLGLIGLAFLGQTGLIFQLKDQNARILHDKETAILEYLKSCGQDCRIDVDQVPQGLKRGWVLHPDYVKPYVLWIASSHGIHKPIQFESERRELQVHSQIPVAR